MAASAAERCDGCGARARYLVELHPGVVLAFCVHHYKASLDNLRKREVTVTDLDEAAAGVTLTW